MKILEKYIGTKTYMYPNGVLATPERVLSDFPAAEHFTHVVETDENGEVLFAFQNLSAMRSIYKIDPALNESEAIQAIQDILNAPPSAPEPTAEERIASALEFQSMMMIPAEPTA